jgi:Type IV secretory system Conjugative DNA transfer
VWRLLNQGDWIATLREAGDKDIPSGFDLLWQCMKRSNAYSGLVAGIGEQFVSMADRTRSSILGTAKASPEFMADPPMQRLLEVSDFDLAALKTDPRGLTLYLTLPQRYMSTHYRPGRTSSPPTWRKCLGSRAHNHHAPGCWSTSVMRRAAC